MEQIREKKHRLPLENYRGCVRASITMCVKDKARLFTMENKDLIEKFIISLRDECEKQHLLNWAYVFMPDHLHVVLEGKNNNADVWKAVRDFKQITSHYLYQKFGKSVKWQKDFYDKIHRNERDLLIQTRYIADNPVRKNLVGRWEDYEFTGSVHKNLHELLNSM